MWLKVIGAFWRNSGLISKGKESYNRDVLHWNIVHRVAALLGATKPAIGGGPSGGYQLESELGLLPITCINAEAQDCNAWDGFLWAVPKRRTSHSKKRMRMTHKYLKPIRHYTICPKCKNVKLLHVLCRHCLTETLTKTAEFRKMKQQRKEEKRLAKQQALSTPTNQVTEVHRSHRSA